MSQQERSAAKKIGKTYLKLAKTMGTLFLLAIIFTGVTVVAARPAGDAITLQPGQSAYLASFYASAGDEAQFAFAIFQQDGKDYHYDTNGQDNNMNGWEMYQYMQHMEWLVQMRVEHASSLDFSDAKVVKDISGEFNVINLELYQDGFYRIKITNHDSQALTIGAGKTEASLWLVATTTALWFLFSITTAIFVFMVQLGLWLLFIYLIIKAIQLIQEENNRPHPQIIGPQDYS